MKFQWYTTLGFCEVSSTLETFGFAFGTVKRWAQNFGFFQTIQNFKVSHFAMAKVKKVNIEVAYSQMAISLMLVRVEMVSRVEHTCLFAAKNVLLRCTMAFT